MDIHYPFQHVPVAAFEAAGLGFSTRERTQSPMAYLGHWPLSIVPQVRGLSPQLCLHPDDVMTVSGPGLDGVAFGASGEGLLVEVTRVGDAHTLAGDDAPRVEAGAVVTLDLGRLRPGLPPGPDRLAQFTNSSLTLFARCELAWIRAALCTWEAHLIDPASAAEDSERIAAEFLAQVAALDVPSAYWAEMADGLAEFGIPTSAMFEFLGGRAILPSL